MQKVNTKNNTSFCKIRVCILVIGILFPTYLVAQLYPLLTDSGSLLGSEGAFVQYGLIKKADTDLTKEIKNFRNTYSKRLQYIAFTSLIAAKIDNEVHVAFNKYQSLVAKNNTLSFFYSSNKKENVKKLQIIEILLNRIKNNINSQYSIGTINGEKLNLYLNFMASLHEINELMDTVEESINKSTLLNTILGR